MPFPILTFYKFVQVQNPAELAEKMRLLLAQHSALGTVLLSKEGVNGSLTASEEALDQITASFSGPDFFSEMMVKRHLGKTKPFRYLNVTLKNEIITFKEEGIDPEREPAARVSPKEFQKWLDAGEELVVIDTRNQFEIGFGKFKGALELNLKSFTDFAAAANKLPQNLKNKKIITYCTGGIRCEKAAPYLKRVGFENVYQLDGGILNYFAEVGGSHWEGECFVFDNRVAVDAKLEETDSSLCCKCQIPIYDPLVKKTFSESERFCGDCQDLVPQHLKKKWEIFLSGKKV